MASFPAAADVTTVNPSGTPQAFALSLADVVRLSTPEGPFPNTRERVAGGLRSDSSGYGRWWWFRTSTDGIPHNYIVRPSGYIFLHASVMPPSDNGGARPAIIIHQ